MIDHCVLCSTLVSLYLEEEESAVCFILIVYQMSYGCLCTVALPSDAMN